MTNLTKSLLCFALAVGAWVIICLLFPFTENSVYCVIPLSIISAIVGVEITEAITKFVARGTFLETYMKKEHNHIIINCKGIPHKVIIDEDTEITCTGKKYDELGGYTVCEKRKLDIQAWISYKK